MEPDELDGEPTSSENAEVDELENEDDVLHEMEHPEQYDHDEDREHPTTEPDEETVKLFEECAKHANRFRNAADEIEVLKPTIIRLKNKFGVKKGYEGRRLIVDGHNSMLWSEFCQVTFNVSAHRMNQLCNAVDKDNKTVITQRGKPDVEKPLYKKGYAKAFEEMIAKGYAPPMSVDENREEHKDNVVEMQAALEPKPLDPHDPYAYFERFRDEPQTMASELATMLVGFNCDDTTLLAALKKELKAQRNEIAKSAKAGN